MELPGRRVLITGASRGIGEVMARRFADAGARVALVARSEEPLRRLAESIGGDAFPADLSDAAAVRGLVPQVEANGGPIDVLVNNAGIDSSGWLPATDPDEIERLYQVNLVAPALLCRAVLPGMIERGRGHIVNVSSLAGVSPFPGLAAYASSKAGLSQFTAGLRADLRGLPVGTTLVEVGPVITDMLDSVYEYEPTKRSFRRFHQLQLLVDLDPDVLAVAVIDAVQRDRRHVRFPKRAAVFPMTTEVPRRLVELFLAGVPHRD